MSEIQAQDQEQNPAAVEPVADESPVPAPASKLLKVLHVQVDGAPTSEDLTNVAEIFRSSLAAGDDVAVVTNAHVHTTLQYVQGEPPVDLILVRRALTAVEAAAIATAAVNATAWNDLAETLRQEYVADAVSYYNTGAIIGVQDGSNAVAFCRVLKSLVPYLLTPSQEPTCCIWSGATNLHEDGTWYRARLSALQPQMIFKMDEYPGKYFVSASAAKVVYTDVDAQWQIESSQAVVSGSAPINPDDLTAGFTLTWKLASAETEAATASEMEAAAQTPEAETPAEDEVEGLTPEQDPQVVTDVEHTDVPDAPETAAAETPESDTPPADEDTAAPTTPSVTDAAAEDALQPQPPSGNQDENTPGTEGTTL